ncbi:hypothetical protein ANCDUO_11441 [Ancylostoma duodenale]|uniref:Uncharacterized protein n=1 Tax=Ancylostoma duodenale TaxID=51022 RepID=A0A0C2CNU2_9BILA|nr:hypothetical protein ANCDUO_11441 [Ancylostoma duodenale]
MLCIWWNVRGGVELWELLAKGSTMIADVYIEQPRNLKAFLENIHDCIKKAIEQPFKGQSPAFWREGIYNLPKRWQKTIDANGTYFK